MTLSMVTRLLASDLNPPHDTRHDTRLPVLTEVEGSMNPLEELDDTTKDSRVWRKARLYWKCFEIYVTYIQGPYLYPVKHDLEWIWYLILSLSVIAYPSIHPFRSGHVITQSHKISATVSSPNGSKLPTAGSFAESIWRNHPSSGRIFHGVGPTNQTPYLTKFWC
jgi:hypothetical protein